MEKKPKQCYIEGDVFEVEKLVGVKVVKGKKLYRVRWRGYGKESDTFEPEENLLYCKDMIEELEESMLDRRKSKKEFKCQIAPPKSPLEDVCKFSEATWQATEVHHTDSNFKDTFWRDFDEGKIDIPDQDMYSKVKGRAARTYSSHDNCKSPESSNGQTEILTPPPLCPKVLLKRKPCTKSNESLSYQSSLKKPISFVRKRKKFDSIKEYKKRRSRMHRKRNINENRQNKSNFKIVDKLDNFHVENGTNILQELLINDEMQGSTTVVHSNSNGVKQNSENVPSTVPKSESPKKSKDYYYEGSKKNNSLMCRITICDKSKGLYAPCKSSMEKPQSSPTSALNYDKKKAFYALLDATVNDELETVEKLCLNQYVINCVQDDGTTALMVAAKLGLYNVAKILLNCNAHKDKQNNRGETALMLACRNKHPKVAKLLLEHGANFAINNADGVNALQITNKYANNTELHSILVEHIIRMMLEFETQAKSVIEHIAQIKHALFPIQCFSVNEGPEYFINFHHHKKLESPDKIGKQHLLFIANSSIVVNDIQCLFDANSVVKHISINGIKQDLFYKGEYSVFKISGLQNGRNKVLITTSHYPESQAKLVVCAYRVHHRNMSWFPTQKLKCEFPE